MVTILDSKVIRDLWNLRAQVLSIALLIASGIAVLIMSVSNYLALVAAMEEHYRSERFADLFAGVKRAPLTLVDRIREIDGMGGLSHRPHAAGRGDAARSAVAASPYDAPHLHGRARNANALVVAIPIGEW